MQEITNAEEFERFCRLEKAILFVMAEWSQPAFVSRSVVNEWLRSQSGFFEQEELDVRCINQDLQFAQDWLMQQAARFLDSEKEAESWTFLQANGTLLWLRKGVVVAYNSSTAYAGIRTLYEQTVKAGFTRMAQEKDHGEDN